MDEQPDTVEGRTDIKLTIYLSLDFVGRGGKMGQIAKK